MNKYFILVLLFGLHLGPLKAQLDPSKLTHFPELDGNLIHDIITDQQGVLWIATQSGLITFDGNEYKRYHPIAGDSTTIGTVLTTRLYMDEHANIWIGCMYDLYKYNPATKSFKKYIHQHLTDFEESRQPVVSSIAPGQNGRIYIGINSFNGGNCTNGLIYYDEKTDSLQSFSLPAGMALGTVYHVETDPKGNTWIISDNGYFKIDTANEIQPVIKPDDLLQDESSFINGFIADQEGSIWMTTNEAILFQYDPESGNTESWSMRYLFENGSYLNYPMAIALDGRQNLWIASHRGLIFFDVQKKQFDVFPDAYTDRVQGDFINCLHIDLFNNLWIGLQSAGMLKYAEKNRMQSLVHPVNEEEGLTYGWGSKVVEQINGNLWLGTQGGIHQFDLETGKLMVVHASTLHHRMWQANLIMEYAPDRLLLHTNMGTGVYETDQNVFRLLENRIAPDSVTLVTGYRDKKNRIWVGTSNGIYILDTLLNFQQHFDLMDWGGTSHASNLIAEFIPAPGQDMWISTNDGLFFYDAEPEHIERHVFDPTRGDVIGVQDINSLYLASDGQLWIGTWLGGLCRYNPATGKVKTYTISDGLPSLSIQGILGDEANNNLWLSTFAGLSRFDIETETFNNYALEDGMQGLLYSDGSYFGTSGGYFFFGGNNGFTYFRPEDMATRSLPPRLFITEFKTGSQFIEFVYDGTGSRETPVVLSHHQNNLSFNYNGIQYDNPAKNKFKYTLENYDDDWREVGNIRSAFYYNLPPGNYTFRVMAANSNDVWNESEATVSFVISPPWWRTWWAYGMYGLGFLFVVFALDRIQRRRLAEKARQQAKEKELEAAREIEKAYHQLKTTQTQLLHAEKMASLGELTAGIAHEIQNPLNFVNNFSEVNAELIDELKSEIKKGDVEESLAIADDIGENEKKIIHHGKRADAIVKSMLQHSRSGNGQKEETNINDLADEYLRLSYHGLRAKDKSFNADYKIDPDPALPKVKVVPQDIGRVLLNLFNNAFQACAERARSNEQDYKPAVKVTTHLEQDHITITVKDNGSGIPPEIREKVFQPFFTTKSTGEGTGLGLSMSYDIITKGHGGTIEIDSEEGKGTAFTIRLKL